MIRLLINSNNVNHRGVTVNTGDIVEEDDKNHIGALQSVGATIYTGEMPVKEEKAAEPEPEKEDPKPEPKPEPVKKKSAPKRKKSS